MAQTQPRDRVLVALTEGGATPVPAVVPYLSIFLRDHWDEIIDQPWWMSQYGSIAERCDVIEAMADATGSEWIQAYECPTKAWRDRHEVVTENGEALLRDQVTGETTVLSRPPVSGYQSQSSLIEARICSMADIESSVTVTSADERDAAGCLDFIRHVKATLGERLCLLASVGGPLWGTYSQFGFNTMMTNLVEAPDLVEALLRRLTDRQIQSVRAYSRAGIDCIWIEDCMTSADLISREHFQRFHAPYVAEIVAEIRAGGMVSVHYFCGDPWDRLEDILGTGVDAVSFEESKKGFMIDIEDISRAVDGRAAILGNLDAMDLLPNASPAQLSREIRRQLEAGRRNGGFAASLGSPVTPETPTERVRLFTDLVRELSV